MDDDVGSTSYNGFSKDRCSALTRLACYRRQKQAEKEQRRKKRGGRGKEAEERVSGAEAAAERKIDRWIERE